MSFLTKMSLAKKISNSFNDLPELAEHLVIMLFKSETAEEFYDYCQKLAKRISKIIDPEDYRDNWHSIYCECDECLRLDEEL